jgi:hypothetical protein
MALRADPCPAEHSPPMSPPNEGRQLHFDEGDLVHSQKLEMKFIELLSLVTLRILNVFNLTIY